MILEVDTKKKKVTVTGFESGEVFDIDKVGGILKELGESFIKATKVDGFVLECGDPSPEDSQFIKDGGM